MFVRTVLCCILAVLVIAVQALPPPTPPATDSKKPASAPPPQKTAVTKKTPAKKAPPPSAAQPTKMYVSRAAIALDVVDREPKDTGSVFPPEVKRLYCFTEIMDGAGEEIQHRWYWNDDLINSVPLGIRSKRHRTYSAKTIIPGMVGEWKVAIVRTTNEELLKTVLFTIK